MINQIYLTSWTIDGARVKLTYSDESSFYVDKTDFDRAFGCIISGDKKDIQRDFALA